MLTLRTLGSLDLIDDEGREITAIVSQPKRMAVLVYLLLARPRGFHRCDAIFSVFWPERDKALGPFIQVDAGGVSVRW